MFLPKSILITGASSGIGAALAKAYARPGITLMLTARHLGRLETVAQQCRKQGAVVETALLDVTEKNAFEDWICAMDDNVPIELVIANAGISAGTDGGVESEAQVERIFATNVDGVMHTIQPLVPRMVKRGTGQVAIMSSLAAYRGLPNAPAYSASKAAVKSYGEGLRGVLAKEHVGVTVITPGYIKTPMTDVNSFPMPMLMEVEEAADIIKTRLRNNPARIAFPFPVYAAAWLLGVLPTWLTDPLFLMAPGKPAMSKD